MPLHAQNLLPKLQDYCKTLPSEFAQIPAERKTNLNELAGFIQAKKEKGESIDLTFICTHNSRRSQFGQVWAKAAAQYYNIPINSYSGGTEATTCPPQTLAAMQRAGFVTTPKTAEKNALHEVVFAEKELPLTLFSKVYNDTHNPQKNFAAILVCSSADQGCPLVMGATLRLYHGYEDPKKSDGTAEESATYDAACRLIAREMFYVFSQIQ